MQYSFRIMISTHEIKNNIDFTTTKKIKMKSILLIINYLMDIFPSDKCYRTSLSLHCPKTFISGLTLS